jgi:hypothetical protein
LHDTMGGFSCVKEMLPNHFFKDGNRFYFTTLWMYFNSEFTITFNTAYSTTVYVMHVINE